MTLCEPHVAQYKEKHGEQENATWSKGHTDREVGDSCIVPHTNPKRYKDNEETTVIAQQAETPQTATAYIQTPEKEGY